MTDADTGTETTALPPPQKFRQALPWWMQVAVLLMVFVAGGLTGAMIASKVIHQRMETYRQQAPVFSQDIVMRLRMRLALTDEQAEKVRRIVERRHSQMIQYRNEGSEKMHNEFDAMVEEIASVLDEDQASRWQQIANYVRARYLPASLVGSAK